MIVNYLLNQSSRLVIVLLSVWLSVRALPALAQSRQITGTVSSKDDGQTLPGANVVVPGTKVGTQTDADGKFSLQVGTGVTKLVITSIGFATQEVSVQGRNTVTVTLSSDNRQLSEVRVVIGVSVIWGRTPIAAAVTRRCAHG